MTTLPQGPSDVNPPSGSKFTALPMNDPELFLDPDDYSLVEVLENNNFDIPTGEKERNIGIRCFPGYLKITLDVIRYQPMNLSHTPSRNTVINACLFKELDGFYSGNFEILSACKAEFKRNGVNAKDTQAYNFISQILTTLPMTVPNTTMDKPDRVNVVVSDSINRQIGNVSEALSWTKDRVVIWSCIRAVSRQRGLCNPEHRQSALNDLRMLMNRVKTAGKIAQICVKGLNDGEL